MRKIFSKFVYFSESPTFNVSKHIVFKSLLTMPSNVLPLHLKQTFCPLFEFSVKVMGSNPGYHLKYFLLYLHLYFFSSSDSCMVQNFLGLFAYYQWQIRILFLIRASQVSIRICPFQKNTFETNFMEVRIDKYSALSI